MKSSNQVGDTSPSALFFKCITNSTLMLLFYLSFVSSFVLFLSFFLFPSIHSLLFYLSFILPAFSSSSSSSSFFLLILIIAFLPPLLSSLSLSFLPTFLLAFLPTYAPPCLPAFLLSCLAALLPSFLPCFDLCSVVACFSLYLE